MPDFSCRSHETELMDEADIPFEEFQDCLRGLEVINQLTLAYRPTLQWLRPWLKSGEPLCILDAGSGGGDMLRRIAGQLPKHRVKARSVRLIGVDLNPWSKRVADSFVAPPYVEHHAADIFDFDPAQQIDLIICSLFTHHLTDAQLVRFLKWIHARARRGWFINDLHRHPLPYYFIKMATGVFSRNRLIRNDAAVSVARSFTTRDWHNLLEKAGIDESVSVRWRFPFRLCLSCEKS